MPESEPQLDLGLSDEDRAVPTADRTDARPAREIPQLDEEGVEILKLERQWFLYAGRKETVIREKFGITTTRYYQKVNALIETEAAMAYDPNLVKRLLDHRDTHKRSRGVRGRLDEDASDR